MTERKRLGKLVGEIAIGYLFLHLNFYIGVFNLLPNWLGYTVIVNVLNELGEEEPSARLLKPFGIILVVWELWTSVCRMTDQQFSLSVIETLIGVISLYFHFQLITNLADIAGKYGYPDCRRLLWVRTVRTLVCTLVILALPWYESSIVTIAAAAIGAAAGIWICLELLMFRKALYSCSNSPD